MLEQPAYVIECSEAGVWVEPATPPGCTVCAGQGCASRQLVELFQHRPRRYRVESTLSLSVGDRVVVGLPEGSLLRSVFFLYGLPLIFILSGAVLAQLLRPGDAAGVSGALVGGLIAWSLTFITRVGRGVHSRPEILRRERLMAYTSKGNGR